MWCLSLDIAESKSQSLLATAVGRNERHVRGQLRFRSSGAMRVEMQETTSPIQDRASAGSINAHAVGTYPEHRLLHELSDRELIAAAAHHLQVLLLHEERCSLRERAFDCRVPRGCFHRVFRVNLPPAARPEDLGLEARLVP